MKTQCTYKSKCNQGDLGDLEVCSGTYEECIIYKRFKSLEPKYQNLEGVTYEDYLGVGAIVKLPRGKNNE